jgi:hypothetical protein
MEMSDRQVAGFLRLGTIRAGVTAPPGHELILEERDVGGRPFDVCSLYQLFADYETKKIRITITVLEERPPETRPVRTIRDLTAPR